MKKSQRIKPLLALVVAQMFVSECAFSQAVGEQIQSQLPVLVEDASQLSDLVSPDAVSNAGVKPNILWIITDDQRADSIAAFNRALRGSSESALGYVESPNVDALAKEGVLFTHAYNQSPGCAPSRYSMGTGQYPHRSGRYGFEYSHRGNTNAQLTIPEVLRANGYQTMLAGKEGMRITSFQKNGVRVPTPLLYDYDVERYAITKAGLGEWGKFSTRDSQTKQVVSESEYFNFPDGTKKVFEFKKNGQPVSATNPVDRQLNILRAYTTKESDMIIAGENPLPGDQTLDGLILKAFNRYLNNADGRYTSILGDPIVGPDTSEPTMISLSFNFPHTPVLPPKSFRDRFKTRRYKIPQFAETELDKLPPQLVRFHKRTKINDMTYGEKQRAIRDYYAFTAYGDSLIGEAVEKFKNYSASTNRPYIILMTVGDHGWHLGEQGVETKFSPWNSSGQGAIIAVDSRGRLFPRNAVHSDFVEYVDIAPTLYAAAGINLTTQSHLDGLDLSEIIKKPALKRDYVLGEINEFGGDRAFLRSKRYAFSMLVRPFASKPGITHEPGENILWAMGASPEDVEMTLYDLACDPKERNNVAYTPRYAGIANQFRTKAQNIFLGDKRLEIDWGKKDETFVSNFANGANDRNLPVRLADAATCTN